MAQIIKGTEKKYAINLTAPGFSMDEDDFELEVAVGKESINGYKNPPQGASEDLLVFKETTTQTTENPEDPENPTVTEVNTWYIIVNTAAFNTTGDMKLIATAHIPDANANGSIRNDIVKTTLDSLINP